MATRNRGRDLLLDLCGALLSTLCAVHCAALPLLLALVPSLPMALHSFEHPWHGSLMLLLQWSRWETWLATGAISFALLSVLLGWRRHRSYAPLSLIAIGILFYALRSVPTSALWHAVLAIAAGLCLAAAHLSNLALLRMDTPPLVPG